MALCLHLCASLALFFGTARGAELPSEDSLLKIALNPDAPVVDRTRAFLDLRAVAGEHAIPQLVALLPDPAWSHSARMVLEAMPGAAAERALIDTLDGAANDDLRIGLIHSLGARRSAAAVPGLAKQLGTANVQVTDAALDALGSIAAIDALNALSSYQPPDSSAGSLLAVTWSDALLRVAEALERSDKDGARKAYELVTAKAPPVQAAAATAGLARLSPRPADVVMAALISDNRERQLAALALIRAGKFGPALTTAVADAIPKLSPARQFEALSVLYDRGDRAAAPAARRALASNDREVQTAAAKLLSVVGEPADAPTLMALMTGADEPAPSARLALARIPGESVTDLLRKSFHGAEPARSASLQVLVARGDRTLVPELVAPRLYTEDHDFAATAASALATLSTGRDLPAVLKLYCAVAPDRRNVVEMAVRHTAAKESDRDVAATAIAAAIPQLPSPERESLYAFMAVTGGDVAFATLSGMAKSDAADVRRSALRALGNWRDLRPVPLLLELARTDADDAVSADAVRSAVQLYIRSAIGGGAIPQPDLVPPAIQGLKQLWTVARQPAEKSAIIRALRNLRSPEAIKAADEFQATEPKQK